MALARTVTLVFLVLHISLVYASVCTSSNCFDQCTECCDLEIKDENECLACISVNCPATSCTDPHFEGCRGGLVTGITIEPVLNKAAVVVLNFDPTY